MPDTVLQQPEIVYAPLRVANGYFSREKNISLILKELLVLIELYPCLFTLKIEKL